MRYEQRRSPHCILVTDGATPADERLLELNVYGNETLAWRHSLRSGRIDLVAGGCARLDPSARRACGIPVARPEPHLPHGRRDRLRQAKNGEPRRPAVERGRGMGGRCGWDGRPPQRRRGQRHCVACVQRSDAAMAACVDTAPEAQRRAAPAPSSRAGQRRAVEGKRRCGAFSSAWVPPCALCVCTAIECLSYMPAICPHLRDHARRPVPAARTPTPDAGSRRRRRLGPRIGLVGRHPLRHGTRCGHARPRSICCVRTA